MGKLMAFFIYTYSTVGVDAYYLPTDLPTYLTLLIITLKKFWIPSARRLFVSSIRRHTYSTVLGS